MLLSQASNCLHWFCEKCTTIVLAPPVTKTSMKDCRSKLDEMVHLLEQLLERTTSIEQKLSEKADKLVVDKLQTRISKLEVGYPVSDEPATKKVMAEILSEQKEETDLNGRRNKLKNLIIDRSKEESN